MRKNHTPALLVAVMLVAALLACEFSFSTANIKSVKMTRDEAGNDETSVYSPTDTFYAIVELANAPDDTKVKAVWKAVDVPGNEANATIDEYELTTGSGTLTFNLTNDSAWPVGKYAVEAYLNGEKKKTVEFEVQEP